MLRSYYRWAKLKRLGLVFTNGRRKTGKNRQEIKAEKRKFLNRLDLSWQQQDGTVSNHDVLIGKYTHFYSFVLP